MSKKELTTREDIFVLVSSFYEKVRENDLLGPFFNGMNTYLLCVVTLIFLSLPS